MGEIHVHQFMTLDGVIDAPMWSFDYEFLPEMGEVLGAVTDRSKAILLGRTTYEAFEPAWSTRTVEDDPGAPFFNDTKKYVVSGTLTEATWNNSEILGAYDPDRIRRLKDEVDGDIFVSGSGTLVRAMLDDGLVDRPAHLHVSADARGGPAAVPGGRRAVEADARRVPAVRARHGLPRLPPVMFSAQGRQISGGRPDERCRRPVNSIRVGSRRSNAKAESVLLGQNSAGS